MSVCRLYCPGLELGSVTLSSEESHHALDVRRLKVGEEVLLFDGAGREGVGAVEKAGRHMLIVNVQAISHRPFELSRKITLAVAMPKGPRAGYLVEKCTELGVAAIWPIVAERSVVQPRPDTCRKWRRRAIEAAKQSRRAWVPEIAPPLPFRNLLGRARAFERVALADTHAPARSFWRFLSEPESARGMLVLIGPEGGWSDAERSQALSSNAVPVGLGPNTLRAETAAVTVCAAVSLLET